MKPENLNTKNEKTWCPGCTNFLILEAVKKAISNLAEKNPREFGQENFAIVTGIGCHAKVFDYLNLSGIYGLHGRVIPTALGIKLGNPNLKVIGFAGDGDTYAEGMEHFIHSFRYNPNMTLVVHDNQSFSLTTGQATPTSQQGYKNKAEPLGEFNKPINPIKLALASGSTFIARINAKDLQHSSEILEKAILHNGFSFVEALQDCLIFNLEADNKDKLMYKIQDNHDKEKAEKLADEFDYNVSMLEKNKEIKIPIGIIYQTPKEQHEKTLEEKWPQLSDLMNKKLSWNELKK